MDISTWAKRAITVQDACNLCGVVGSMRDWLAELANQGHDTNYCNTHPVTIMFASKVHSLAGAGLTDPSVFSRAYARCKELASPPLGAAV